MNEEIIDNLEITEKNPSKKNAFLIVFSLIYSIANFIACLFAFEQIRTIVISAFVLAAFAIVEIIVSLSLKKRAYFYHGIIGIVTILTVFLAINIFDLTPRKAENKLPFLMVFLSFFHLVFNLFILYKEPKKQKHIL
jgi:hypothetical protein